MRDATYKELRERKVDKPLGKHVAQNYKMLLFPINGNMNMDLSFRSNHWTLFVLFVEEKKWRFYNSNLPRGQNRIDPYVEDAKVVTRYVQQKMNEISELPAFSLHS